MLALFVFATISTNFWYLFEFNYFVKQLNKQLGDSIRSEIKPSIFVSDFAVIGLKYVVGINKIPADVPLVLARTLVRARIALLMALISFFITLALLLL